MIRPNHFGFNPETADSNSFQKNLPIDDVIELAKIQFDQVVKELRSQYIAVDTFEDQDASLPDAVFSNNWLAGIPTNVLTVFPMATETRQKEVRKDIIEWVQQVYDYHQLIDLTSNCEDGRFLEGTGSIVFDHFTKTAFACESQRTSIPLFEAYCGAIGYLPVSFESSDLTGLPIYHTNVMLSIAEHYVIINLDSVQNQLEKSFLKARLQRNGRKLIEISYAQMARFAANVIEVKNNANASCLIMSETAYAAFNVSQLEVIQSYSKIIVVDVSLFEQIGGGGIRCMITGLFR